MNSRSGRSRPASSSSSRRHRASCATALEQAGVTAEARASVRTAPRLENLLDLVFAPAEPLDRM